MSVVASLHRVRLIAGMTFLEAVRQKFFNALLLIAMALVGSSTFFQQFDFGAGELKFITDFGFGALFFFGSILAITVTAQLFFNELENRTALTLLAKPVFKLEFLAGKFLGAQLLLLCFTLLVTAVLAGILVWRESTLLVRLGEPEADFSGWVRYGDVFLFGFLQWVKFGILAAITLFVASFAQSNLYAIVLSFFILIICQLQYIARDAYATMASGWERLLVGGLGLLFPNFQLFNVGDQLVFQATDGLPVTVVVRMVLYGLTYTVAFILLAHLNFRQREL